MNLAAVLTALYGLCGVAMIVAYGPQAWSAWQDKEGAQAVSLASWGFWMFSSLVTLLYAVVVVKDLPWTMVSFGNVVGCSAVFSAAAWRRWQFNRLTVPAMVE